MVFLYQLESFKSVSFRCHLEHVLFSDSYFFFIKQRKSIVIFDNKMGTILSDQAAYKKNII